MGVESQIILVPQMPKTVKRVGTTVFPAPLKAHEYISIGT